MEWPTSRRRFSFERPLIMGILNVTPDSFSDGGRFADADQALQRVEEMIAEGVDIIDIGGESTRPGSNAVSAADEIERTAPIIREITKRFDIAVSIDTWKAETARAAVEAGAEIINDISGMRWDERLGEVAAKCGCGIVLMHSRGTFETMHKQEPVSDIFAEVTEGLRRSVAAAENAGVVRENIALDIGIGFGKTLEQNLALMGRLDQVAAAFPGLPVLVGASRKSFIAKVLGDVPADQRIGGSLAAALIAAEKGARILRVHDVRETVQALRIAEAIKEASV